MWLCPECTSPRCLRRPFRLLLVKEVLLLLPPLLDLQLNVLQPPPKFCRQCRQVVEAQLAQICHLIPKHQAFFTAPAHATIHAPPFLAPFVREVRDWDLGLLVVVVLLLVFLLLLVVLTEGLRGQTRGVVD